MNSDSDSGDDFDRVTFNNLSSSKRLERLAKPMQSEVSKLLRRPQVITNTSLVRLRVSRLPPTINTTSNKPFKHEQAPTYDTGRSDEMCILEFLLGPYMTFLCTAQLKTKYDYLKAFYFALPKSFRTMWLKKLEEVDENDCNSKKSNNYLVKIVTEFCSNQTPEFVWNRNRWRNQLPKIVFKDEDTMTSFLDKFFYGVQKAYQSVNSITVIQTIIQLIWNALPPKLRNDIERHPDFGFAQGVALGVALLFLVNVCFLLFLVFNKGMKNLI